jgi:hypothetical protein
LVYGFKIHFESEEPKLSKLSVNSTGYVDDFWSQLNDDDSTYKNCYIKETVIDTQPGYQKITGYCELKILNREINEQELNTIQDEFKALWLMLLATLLTYDDHLSDEKKSILNTNAMLLFNNLPFDSLNDQRKVEILYVLLHWQPKAPNEWSEAIKIFLKENYLPKDILSLLLIAPYYLNNEVYLTYLYNQLFNSPENFQQNREEMANFLAKEKNYFDNLKKVLEQTYLSETAGKKLTHIYCQLYQIATGTVPTLVEISTNSILWNDLEFQFMKPPGTALENMLSSDHSESIKKVATKFNFFKPEHDKTNVTETIISVDDFFDEKFLNY